MNNKENTIYQGLEFIHFAILEALENNNLNELQNALVIVELMREPHLKEKES